MSRSLAIVVVNFGSSDLLESNLVRVSRDVPDALIIVVDNFSSPEERSRVRMLGSAHGWLVRFLEDNRGFGAGANVGSALGFERGVTDVLLLNPDAWIDAVSVARLQDAVDTDRMLLVAPTVLTGEGQIWFDGADLYLADGLTRATRRRDERPGMDVEPWLSGACLLVTHEIWERTGGFDDEYFLYWEDVDFSHRVRLAGGRLAVVDAAVAIHDEGGTQTDSSRSERAKSEGYYYYNIRNRMLFAARHLDDGDVRRWARGIGPSAREILLRGGRRQFLRPLPAARAFVRGIRAARRITRSRLSDVGRTRRLDSGDIEPDERDLE